MNKKALFVQRVQHRPGDGHQIDMVVRSSDAESTTYELETSTLPVPERKYTCDAVQVVSGRLGARILLAQRHPVGESLLCKLVINMPAEGVVQFTRSINEEFRSQARDYVQSHNGQEVESEFSQNAEQSVVLTSSYVLAGYTGLAACMDFYNASPFSVQNMLATKKLALESVVRVHMSAGALLVVIDALERATQQWDWAAKVKRPG